MLVIFSRQIAGESGKLIQSKQYLSKMIYKLRKQKCETIRQSPNELLSLYPVMDCLAEGIRENWQNSVFLAVAGCCFVTNSAINPFPTSLGVISHR